jgi:hypothetical protein
MVPEYAPQIGALSRRTAPRMNVVMTGSGGMVEIQGTAEGEPFTRKQMNTMMDLADKGIRELMAAQNAALGSSVKSFHHEGHEGAPRF